MTPTLKVYPRGNMGIKNISRKKKKKERLRYVYFRQIEKTRIAKIYKSLIRYKSENDFVWTIKIM